MNNKFEKVKKALENKTYNTNVMTKSLKAKSYKTLNDIIKEFELEIN